MPISLRVAYPSGSGWAPRKIPGATRPMLGSPGRLTRCSKKRLFPGRTAELSPVTPHEEALPGAAAWPGDTPGGASSPNRRRRAATRRVRPAKDSFPVAAGSMTMESTDQRPDLRRAVTVSPAIPQLSVSTSSISTIVDCGFFPSTSTNTFVTPRITSAFFSGVTPSRVILIFTKGISEHLRFDGLLCDYATDGADSLETSCCIVLPGDVRRWEGERENRDGVSG